MGSKLHQDIQGEKHQVAGRDIINHWHKESNRPRLLNELKPDELRAQRAWSKQIIQEAKSNMWTSWTAKTLMITIPLFLGLTWWLNSLPGWLWWCLWPTMVFPGTIQMRLVQREQRVIQNENQVLETVYYLLRRHGVDEPL